VNTVAAANLDRDGCRAPVELSRNHPVSACTVGGPPLPPLPVTGTQQPKAPHNTAREAPYTHSHTWVAIGHHHRWGGVGWGGVDVMLHTRWGRRPPKSLSPTQTGLHTQNKTEHRTQSINSSSP
jgi:hypothetical protein